MTDFWLSFSGFLECLSSAIVVMPIRLTFALPTKILKATRPTLASRRTRMSSSCSSSIKWKTYCAKRAKSTSARIFFNSNMWIKKFANPAALQETACAKNTLYQCGCKTFRTLTHQFKSWSTASSSKTIVAKEDVKNLWPWQGARYSAACPTFWLCTCSASSSTTTHSS